MVPFTMSLCVVAAFLLLTLVMGIYFSRKQTTFREYAIGNKDFATATLVATVLATNFGAGVVIRTTECVHEHGLWWIILMFLGQIGFWIIGRLALRMGPFMKHLSIAETIGSVYGKYPRAITALVSISCCIVVITIQINVMSQAINICLDLMDLRFITILSTLLLVFYSTFGGMRVVTYTGVFQFITFSIIIPLFCWFIFVQIGKPVAEIVPIFQTQAKFQFSTLFHSNTKIISLVLLLLSGLAAFITPEMIQRVYMSSGPIQAQKAFSYATLFSFIIISFVLLTGLFVFAGAPDLPKAQVWGYVMNHIPPSFKEFLAIGLLAMAMSTADACLNACAVIVSHDIVKIVQKEKEILDAFQLKIARWTTLMVGLLAMLMAFLCQDLLELMYWSLDCIVPIVTAPFILAIFGFRGTARTALIGMATGLLTILAWNRWVKPIIKMDGSFLAMVANSLAMMAAHYLLKQPKGAGWVEPDNAFKQMQQENARKRGRVEAGETDFDCIIQSKDKSISQSVRVVSILANGIREV